MDKKLKIKNIYVYGRGNGKFYIHKYDQDNFWKRY